MARVAVLPDALANQIAAGEVVERPASVVKELVENALDAGATAVFVDLEEGGRRLVRVVDDGHGMGREDASLAVQRHATSKIRAIDDLRAIETLGFRGEALPSIASVSRFRLVTREADAVAGTEILIEGGAAPVVRDAGGPVGTRVEVRDLFYNVPARLKFLKQVATEVGHVQTLLTATALGYPHVHVRLTHNGRVRLDHPVAPSLKQRIFQVLGRQTTERLYEVRLDGPIRVRGYVSDPGWHRTNQAGVHTFVNGRLVRDRVVTHALVSAYGGLLERGRHPYAVLYVHLAPSEVDVNVHPTKAEVRFVAAGQVHEAILRACRITLGATPWAGGLPVPHHAPARDRAGAPAAAEPRRTPLPLDAWGLGRARPPAAAAEGAAADPGAEGAAADAAPAARGPDPRAPGVLRAPRAAYDRGPAPPHARELVVAPEPGDAPAEAPGTTWEAMRPLGVAGGRWLVAEAADALVVLDVPAARAWLAASALREAVAAGAPARRPLLIPVQVEASAPEQAALEARAEALAALGFELTPFGGTTWLLAAVPAALAGADPERVAHALLAAAPRAAAPAPHEAFAAACAAVVAEGPAPAEGLLDALAAAGAPPAGAPFAERVAFGDLARRLSRG